MTNEPAAGERKTEAVPVRRRAPLHLSIFAGLVGGAVAGGAANAILGADDPALERLITHVAEPA